MVDMFTFLKGSNGEVNPVSKEHTYLTRFMTRLFLSELLVQLIS